jgi:hypothetical protein
MSGWVPFDRWAQQHGLTLDNLPAGHEYEQAQPELPPQSSCRSKHEKRHRQGRPSKTCRCGCSYCEVRP